jgi:F-type H+-transporting ATPase subunit alpha
VGCQVAIVYAVIHGWLDEVPVDGVRAYEQRLFERLQAEYPELLERLEKGFFDDSDVKALESALEAMWR